MSALAGGVLAAVLFATATVSSSRSSRMLGSTVVLAWVMAVGLVLVAVPLALSVGSIHPSGADWAWLAVSGSGNLVGLLFEYTGLKLGKVAIVAAIASSEGALAALISAALGESIHPLTGALLGVIAIGIVLACLAPDAPASAGASGGRAVRQTAAATAFAVAAALTFAISLYATGRVSGRLPVAVVVAPARILGAGALALPLALGGRLRMTRRALPYVLLSGCCEIGGLTAFSLGARHGIAVSAVLASQFAAIAAVGAFALYGERLGRWQLAGVATIVTGVSVLAAVPR